MNAIPLWQRLVGGVVGIGAGVALTSTLSGKERALGYLPLFCLFAAAIAIHVPRLGAQLFARGAWWSNFGLGVFISAVGNSRGNVQGLEMAIATAVPLVLVGQKGLGEASERDGFSPAAFRTTFMLLMVLVLADAQTLGLFWFASFLDHATGSASEREGWVLGAGSLAMLVAFFGLYRITLWGVITSLVASIVLAVTMTMLSGINENLTKFVIAISVFQIVVACPMLFALVTKKTLPAPPPVARGLISRVVIVGLLAYSVFIVATR